MDGAQRAALADLLQRHMDRRGMTQSELAREIGVADATVWRWRNGAAASLYGKTERALRLWLARQTGKLPE